MTDRPTDTTDASLSECGHERFERNHYFHGKLMTARDMAAEQAYHAGQRRAHARSVAGSGVAWGLDCAVESDGDDAVTVTVERGYAVDDCGRAVVVPQTRETTVTDAATVGAESVSVWLNYAACLKESVPVDGAESACEDECAYNRVLEVYDVAVEPGTPEAVPTGVESVTFPGWDDLASVTESGRERPAADDPGLATIAESFRERAGDAAGEEGAVFLGSFAAGADGSWSRIEERPTESVYTNDMLYAATARHAADFGNPHEVTLATDAPADANAATLRVRDDDSDSPEVTVASTDDTVTVGHAAAERRIDLSVESYVEESVDDRVEEVVEARLEPLERHAMEQTLKYKALVFRGAAGRFGDEAGDLAGEVAGLARRAVDARLAGDREGAAERRRAREEGEREAGDAARERDGGADAALLSECLELERKFHEAVAERVTDESAERLERALDRLEAGLEPERPATLAMATAQDDVADAVEWLEPTEREEREEAAETGRATFSRAAYEGSRGDVVEMDVDLEGTESATLTVGSEEAGYRSTLDVRSGGGGRVTVLMNSYLAGRGDESAAFDTADAADDVTATLETAPRGSVLDAGSYDLGLAVDGTETDVGVLTLEARATESVAVRRAPGDRYGELTTVGAVDAAREAGALVAGEVTPGDAVVATVAATGVFGAVADAVGGSTVVDAAGVEALFDGEPLSLSVEQTGAVDGQPKRLDVRRSVADGAARVLVDRDGGRLFLVVDSAAATLRRGADGDARRATRGEEYRVEFSVRGGSPLADRTETVADAFSMAGLENVSVPKVVGSSYDAAAETISNEGLSPTASYQWIDSATYLDTAYGNVVEQDPAPGTSVAAGEEVTLTVLTSRPVGELEGIGPTYEERLAERGIEWVHELEAADPGELEDAIRNVGRKEIEGWIDGATDYRVALDLSLTQDVTLEEARAVSPAFRESGRTNVTELDDDAMESIVTTAANDDAVAVTAESAGTFLERSRTLRFDPDRFEYGFDSGFDPTL